ncbi:MAG: LysR family transcriptional regulator [Desulfarculus sp.]|nr:LysR family transcriptional regulator [Desulfarculus sp.]
MPRRHQQPGDNALAQAPAGQGLQVKGRIWLERDGQTYLSWGRVVLLERIGQAGSVAAAARSMGMSYRHAWGLVREMNQAAGLPLVERRAGGQGGGGAMLTEAGQGEVTNFWALAEQFQAWLSARRPRQPGDALPRG